MNPAPAIIKIKVIILNTFESEIPVFGTLTICSLVILAFTISPSSVISKYTLSVVI